MIKKTILTAACATAAVLSLQAHAEDGKVLRMACESTYAPFVFFDTQTRKPVGFEIDLLEYAAKQMGRKLEVTNMGFDAIIPAILTGITDVGASAFTITPERAKRVLFSKPYYMSGLSILVRAEDKDKIKSVKDIENCTICAQIGTSGSMRAAKVPGAKVRNFNTINEAYLELNNKGCRAVIGDRPVTAYFLASRPQAAADYHHLPETRSLRLSCEQEQQGACQGARCGHRQGSRQRRIHKDLRQVVRRRTSKGTARTVVRLMRTARAAVRFIKEAAKASQLRLLREGTSFCIGDCVKQFAFNLHDLIRIFEHGAFNQKDVFDALVHC